MSESPQALLTDEETTRLQQIMSNLRTIQKITNSCLETMEEMLVQADQIARRHGLAVVTTDGDVIGLTRRNGGRQGT